MKNRIEWKPLFSGRWNVMQPVIPVKFILFSLVLFLTDRSVILLLSQSDPTLHRVRSSREHVRQMSPRRTPPCLLARSPSLWGLTMAACLTMFRLSRRAQYVFLLVLCISILAWVATPTFSPVKTFTETNIPVPGRQTEPEWQVTESVISITKEIELESRGVCPETSSLLRKS